LKLTSTCTSQPASVNKLATCDSIAAWAASISRSSRSPRHRTLDRNAPSKGLDDSNQMTNLHAGERAAFDPGDHFPRHACSFCEIRLTHPGVKPQCSNGATGI